MTTNLKKFGIIDTTYEHLLINNYEIKNNFEMSLVLKATGFFEKYTLTDLQALGYNSMYDELIDELTKRGLI